MSIQAKQCEWQVLYLSTKGTHGAVTSQGETEFTGRVSIVR